MLDSEQIHTELNKLGFFIEDGKNEPAYAYEHALGDGKYLYVKRKAGQSVGKAPLVLHPDCLPLRQWIDSIEGLLVHWEKTKSTSYRRYPRDNGSSQFGYAADVTASSALADLIALLTAQSPSQAADTLKDSQIDNSQKDLPMPPLNQILYGPPGTGKTYATTELAVSIAEPQWYQELRSRDMAVGEYRQALVARYGELVAARRIDFTTFHQSFSYEDFVEGIRADMDDGKLSYRIEDGVFKRLALAASRGTVDQCSLGLAPEPRIWKLSIGERSETQLRQHYIARGEARIGWNDTGDLEVEYDNRDENARTYWDGLTSKTQGTISYFQEGIKVGDVLLCLKDKDSVQAIGIVSSDYRYDPDESGMGFNHVRSVNWILTDINFNILQLNNNTRLVQQAVYPLDRMTWKDILAELPRQQITLPAALNAPSQRGIAPNYVLIIDEINRGNISRIFGELITLLEPSKRKGAHDAQTAVLPYSKTPFSVPDNVYVIGTMNTADKSLAQLDLALRRRFSFTEMLPQPQLLQGVRVFDVDLAEILTVINQRIEVLLDAEHLIGHSYFIPLISIEDETVRQQALGALFKDKLLPLLQEYFFDDHQRIGWVLNDPGKHPDDRFIITDEALRDSLPGLQQLFSADIADQLMDRRYRIHEKAFARPEAYQGIVK